MEGLLDTSWSLHFISTNSNSYNNLFSPSTTQHHLTRYFDRLPQFLASQKPQYVDDLDDPSEKLGTLRDCRYTILRSATSLPAAQASPIIQLLLIYQNSAFTFTLYTPYLVLSKAPATQTKHVLDFLANTFSIAASPLKLPSTLLSQILEGYVSALLLLTRPTSIHHHDHHRDGVPSNGLESERRAALLRAAIGQLKLTISFSGPVAPHLRTIDLSIPYETVDTLVSMSAPHASDRGFMSELAKHVHLQTGMRLPLTPDAIADGQGENDSSSSLGFGGQSELLLGRPGEGEAHESSLRVAPLRLSKLTSAGFAISVDGKLKFAGKAVENAIDQEELVTSAYLSILDSVAKEAREQGEGDSS